MRWMMKTWRAISGGPGSKGKKLDGKQKAAVAREVAAQQEAHTWVQEGFKAGAYTRPLFSST